MPNCEILPHHPKRKKIPYLSSRHQQINNQLKYTNKERINTLFGETQTVLALKQLHICVTLVIPIYRFF